MIENNIRVFRTFALMYQSALQQIVPAGFADNSRVWIYQSSRPFNDQEVREIKEQLYQFYVQWQAHGMPVKGWADLLFERIIVLMADETDVLVSGCSTDSSVRVIKSLERQYNVTLFDRLSITFLVKGQPEVLPLNQVQYAIDKGFIDGDTILFNNLVANKKELLNQWLQPLKNSWLSSQVLLREDNTASLN